MSIKITTLVENSPGEHLALKHEHGLCFHIEKDGRRILFDTGQSDALIHNAAKLMIDLSDLEQVVISHGHYDHSGGLRPLVQVSRDFRLTVGRGFFEAKYAYYNGAYEYLGNDFDERFLREQEIRVQSIGGDLLELLPGVHVLTGFERGHEDEKVNPRFRVFRNGEYLKDSFDDELLVAVDSPKGLIVLLGCSHPGVKNMLDTVIARLEKPIYAVMGGTHLVESTGSGLQKTIDYFLDRNIQAIGVSHCTGKAACERMGALGDRFFHNRTGSCLVVG